MVGCTDGHVYPAHMYVFSRHILPPTHHHHNRKSQFSSKTKSATPGRRRTDILEKYAQDSIKLSIYRPRFRTLPPAYSGRHQEPLFQIGTCGSCRETAPGGRQDGQSKMGLFGNRRSLLSFSISQSSREDRFNNKRARWWRRVEGSGVVQLPSSNHSGHRRRWQKSLMVGCEETKNQREGKKKTHRKSCLLSESPLHHIGQTKTRNDELRVLTLTQGHS